MAKPSHCPLSEARAPARVFVFLFTLGRIGKPMYFAYLDEFGHIGRYISRDHARHNDSPIFGLAGFVIPAAKVRWFATWVFQRKNEMFASEITRSGKIAARWEKKGSRLYTVANMTRYPQLRRLTNRLLAQITNLGGLVFYVGVEKRAPEEGGLTDSRLYRLVLVESIKRIDQFCQDDCTPKSKFVLVLDEHSQRSEIVTAAGQSMFGGPEPRRQLLEPPFQVESNRYQTVQAADWIAGLIGRIGAYCADPDAYQEHAIFVKYFGRRVLDSTRRSGIRDATHHLIDMI